MKLPTPLVAIVGGGLGIAAAVLGFQTVTAITPTSADVSQVADLNATQSPSATEENPTVEETPSATASSTPSVKPSPKEEHKRYVAPTTQSSPATTWHESESESGSGYSSESGDD